MKTNNLMKIMRKLVRKTKNPATKANLEKRLQSRNATRYFRKKAEFEFKQRNKR